MSELVLQKTPNGVLFPVDPYSARYVDRLKIGEGVTGDFKRARNPKFHRKGMSLLTFAFDMWDAPELDYKGQTAEKNFDRFRKDLTILSGHFNVVTTINGQVRLEAKSLKFAKMDEDEFEEVYHDLITTIWSRILKSKGYESPEHVEHILDELRSYEQ